MENIYISYHKIVLYGLLLLGCFLLVRCEDSKQDAPETPPEISVYGQNPQKTGIYLHYKSDSLIIRDLYGIDTVWAESNIDTALLGYYKITYYALSLSGMESSAQRDVWTVIKPESMTGVWDVTLYYPDINLSLSRTDSVRVEDHNLILSNFSIIEGAKIKLSLAGDLQDSVYIAEQFIADSLYTVFGNGIIDETATEMTLFYNTIDDKDTIFCRATYTRDSIMLF